MIDHYANGFRFSAMHLARLPRDYAVEDPHRLRALRRPVGRGLRVAAADVPGSLAAFEQKWARRNDPHCFSGVWRFHELLPFAPLEQCVTVGEGQTLLRASAGVARYRHRPWPARLAIRGPEPLGQLQGQRHGGGLQPCPARRRHAAPPAPRPATPAHRWPCTARPPADAAGDFIGSGKISYGKLSQALDYGGADAADPRRFRRRHGPGARGLPAVGHLPGQQRQPLPARRPEDDHVSACWKPSAGARPIGSPCPAEISATAAPSARRSTSCTSWG